MQVKVKAPAKINLTLDIVGKRSDGYHDVAMILQSISLFDTVIVDADNEDYGEEIKVSCNDPLIPTDDSNIVVKTSKEFFSFTNTKSINLSIDIQKEIPSQAGLAGGSTDGAAVILALNYILETHLDIKDMAKIAQKVGSDIPFCLYGGTMLAEETGTKLSKLISLPKCHIVLVKPDISISTKEAYDKCDSKAYKVFRYTDEAIKQITSRNIRALSNVLYNEFEQVLSLEEINDIKKFMIKNKALGASMSGSGSAVYGIFLNEKKAIKCKELLSEQFDNVYLCEPIKDGCKII